MAEGDGLPGPRRRRQRVHRLHVQLRTDRARAPPPRASTPPPRAQQRAGDCQNGPGAVIVELAELLRRRRRPRRLGDVRQERHRRDDDVRDGGPGGDRDVARCSWPRAPTTAPRRGARRPSPASCPRTAPTCCTTATTTSSRSRRRRRVGRRRRRRDRRVAVQARRPPRPGARRPGVRRRACARSATTRARRSILDDVRCGFRLAHGGSWEPIGVAPRPVGVEQGDRQRLRPRRRAGNDRFRDGAERIFVTGSFWFSAVAMAAVDRDDRRARRRGRRGLDGAHRPAAA